MKEKALLVFPPVAMRMLAPEIGLPVLAGWLNANGVGTQIIDINAHFLFRWLSTPYALDLLKNRWLSRDEAFRKKCPEYKISIDKCVQPNADQIAYVRVYTELLNPPLKSWHLHDVISASLAKDELFEAVYDEFLKEPAKEALFIGFSMESHEQLPAALYISRRLKEENPGIKIVFGGPWATASLSVINKWDALFSLVDYVCFYAGELPVLGIARHLQGIGEIKDIPGIAWLDGNKVAMTPLDAPPGIRNAPIPNFDGMPLEIYPQRKLAVRNSSGCIYGKCTFCYHCFPNNRYQERSPETTVKEMFYLAKKYGMYDFEFADLSVSPQMLMSISKCILSLGGGITWNAMTRADYPYSANFAKLLFMGGCRELSVGVEIQDNSERIKLNKGIRDGNFEKMLESCIRAGIHVNAFLLNYPGVDPEKFLRSMDYFNKLNKESNGNMAFIMADFELGRASNSMSYLDMFGICLPEDIDMDVRSFSLPFSTRMPWKRLYE